MNLSRLALALLLAVSAWGQGTGTSVLVVTTHTMEGKAITDATVSVSSGVVPRTAVADSKGVARIAGLTPGRYTLTILAKGYDELTTDVDVGTEPETSIDALLSEFRTESITVQGVIEAPLDEANTPSVLERTQVRNMPDRPRTVTEALPLAPGIVRLPNGQLRLSGSGEHRSALLVNSATATDPATGQFGATVPIDSIGSMSILSSPFLAEYGGFTGDVVSVETRKGGDKWNFELNDPLPEFRWRSWHMVGLRSSTPRVVLGGPIVKNRLFILESIQYDMREYPVITLPFPNNESRRQGLNSLTALDYTINGTNVLTGTAHVANQRTRYDNLDFFNPQPVSPDTAFSTYAAEIAEHSQLRGTVLDSQISGTSFRAGVWPQGDLPMVLQPQGNSGNYFSRQTRTSSRVEWRESWSLVRQFWGTHNFKVGSRLGWTNEHANVNADTVRIENFSGRLLENIDFIAGRPIARSDLESAFFAQDQWVMSSRFSLNYGVRAGQQEVTDVFQIGPRAGFVFTPTRSGKTILRAGAGVFYDRVPLNVYGFAFYPNEVITTYNPDGSVFAGPDRYFNITEAVAPHRSPFTYRKSDQPGDFAPYSINLNIQLEQIVTARIRLRANFLQSRSEGLIVMAPRVTDAEHAYVQSGDGNARLRQFELTAAGAWGKDSQFNISYVHSQSLGNLNEFNNYLANFPPAVILQDAHTNLPGDTPHRFIGWGTIQLPHKFRIMPKLEYRSGFPWSSYTAIQQYAGLPNSARFPAFLSLDARITKDFRVTDKYSFRFGVTASDLSNHFNPVSVHSNVADPNYGVFFGTYRRRYTADFDVLF